MAHAVRAEGDSVQDAIDAALEDLGVGPDDVEIEILDEPNKGLLGLRKAKARVLVTVRDHETVAREVIVEIMTVLGAGGTVDSYSEDDELWVTVKGESLSWLIGHHGRTLDALQVLAGSIVNRRMKAAVRVIFDIEGYRSRRKKEVQELAERTIGKVLADQVPISLKPMSAIERKAVHLAAGQYDGVDSASEGADPDRFVVISPAKSQD